MRLSFYAMPVLSGLDAALEAGVPWGRARAGLLTHRAAVTAGGRPGWAALLAAGARIERLFSPEHGLDMEAAAGEPVADRRDALTGLPVSSLYGESREPRPQDLEGLEALVIDLQDAGARCYTYSASMALCLEAAGRAGLPVWLLDRPNPVTGRHAEGTLPEPAFRSFVSWLPVPLRHGLTMGELARLAAPPGLELHVVPLRGWTRDQWWDETGRPWVPPSPALVDPDVALAYAGTVLLEATRWDTGRGTAEPFRTVGGSRAIRVDWDDRDAFRPVAAGIRLLARLCAEEGCRWSNPRHLDLLYGSDRLRRTLEAGASVEPLIEEGAAAARRFTESCSEHLLY